MNSAKKVIAVIGATGQQGGGVVRALQASGQFKVRALTRNPAKHAGLGDEVVLADFNKPETLAKAFAGAYGAFVVTNAWEAGADESKQALAAIKAAKEAGVSHFIWSTLPNVEKISGGEFDVHHFTAKAKIEHSVSEARFHHHTFVIAPFYYQNLIGQMTVQKLPDGSMGWALPLDPARRVVHMGDITELGRIVAGAFEHPELAGHGEHLALVGDLLSFNDIVSTLNNQGHSISYAQVPREVFANFFPGADSVAAMLAYFEKYTYLGSESRGEIALANKVAGQQPTKFAAWAKTHFKTAAAA